MSKGNGRKNDRKKERAPDISKELSAGRLQQLMAL